MIKIVDYGAGNLKSVRQAFSLLGYEAEVLAGAEGLPAADRIVLPGVGSFGYAMGQIRQRGLFGPMKEWMESGRPLLGICLGLQLLTEGSQESPGVPGFGIFPGSCQKFLRGKVPHLGWNSLRKRRKDDLFSGIRDGEFFYFANSYYPVSDNHDCVLADSEYRIEFAAALRRGRICGVQFHPEKSGSAGLRLIRNWVEKC
jgi:imidazole glycerol phosphate synthase glutamine amidotransferase subunit